MALRILVVDDEPAILQMVSFALRKADFEVVTAGDAREARAALVDQLPDLVLLDWMLPGTSGLELAQSWRRDPASKDVPIIMLSAKGQEDDRVSGLEAGVDDYVVKPFSARELVARINAVLRRSSELEADGSLEVGALHVDTKAQRVLANQQALNLGPTEYRLLLHFMTQRDRVLSRGQLLDQVWGGNVYIEDRTVDVHIRRLRKALEPHQCDWMLQTVRGSGYRFSDQRPHGG